MIMVVCGPLFVNADVHVFKPSLCVPQTLLRSDFQNLRVKRVSFTLVSYT